LICIILEWPQPIKFVGTPYDYYKKAYNQHSFCSCTQSCHFIWERWLAFPVKKWGFRICIGM